MPSQGHEDSPGCGNARERNRPCVQWLWCCLGAVFPVLTISLASQSSINPVFYTLRKSYHPSLKSLARVRSTIASGLPLCFLSLLQLVSAKMFYIPGSLIHPYSLSIPDPLTPPSQTSSVLSPLHKPAHLPQD